MLRRTCRDLRLERRKSADIPIGGPVVAIAYADRETARPTEQAGQLPETDDCVESMIRRRCETQVRSKRQFIDPVCIDMVRCVGAGYAAQLIRFSCIDNVRGIVS